MHILTMGGSHEIGCRNVAMPGISVTDPSPPASRSPQVWYFLYAGSSCCPFSDETAEAEARDLPTIVSMTAIANQPRLALKYLILVKIASASADKLVSDAPSRVLCAAQKKQRQTTTDKPNGQLRILNLCHSAV